MLVRPVFNAAVAVHAKHRADGGDSIDLGASSDGYRCGPHPGSDSPPTFHPPFPPRRPGTGDFSSLRSGSGCSLCPGRAMCPRRDGGRVCLHLCGHDAKHLPPSERLGRGSNYLFQDKNNSSNLRAAASFPAHGGTRIILVKGGGETPMWGSSGMCPHHCSPNLGPESGPVGAEEAGAGEKHHLRGSTEHNLLAKQFICQKMLFSRGGGGE